MSLGVDFYLGEYSQRTLLRITGVDAAAYLHNLSTQDIRTLKAGECREAYITSVQGKTIGFVRVYQTDDGLLLETAAGQSEALLAHFEKYHIREKIELSDVSLGAHAFVISTKMMSELLRQEAKAAPIGVGQFRELSGELSGALITSFAIGLPDLVLGIASNEGCFEAVLRWANSLGARRLSNEEVEARRIAAGSFEFGADITPENLPQEIGRDATAISFTKGCYLGQETVARIDALGHVNRQLVKLRGGESLQLQPSDSLTIAEKVIGQITSVANWNAGQCTVAIALVRRGSHLPGTELSVGGAKLKVVA